MGRERERGGGDATPNQRRKSKSGSEGWNLEVVYQWSPVCLVERVWRMRARHPCSHSFDGLRRSAILVFCSIDLGKALSFEMGEGQHSVIYLGIVLLHGPQLYGAQICLICSLVGWASRCSCSSLQCATHSARLAC